MYQGVLILCWIFGEACLLITIIIGFTSIVNLMVYCLVIYLLTENKHLIISKRSNVTYASRIYLLMYHAAKLMHLDLAVACDRSYENLPHIVKHELS
jgi:hypothetical protein